MADATPTSSSGANAEELAKALEAELFSLKLREQHAAEAAAHGDALSPEPVDAHAFPSMIVPASSPDLARLKGLWARFQRWVDAEEGAAPLLHLNGPASARDFFLLQRSLAGDEGEAEEGAEAFELPQDLAASFACHDGQDWDSVTGLMGRWYLLDASAVFAEWRDQKDMVEMGLYTGTKYNKLRKAAGSHPRIDTSSWFNPRWIPIACSRGRNLGGDLICVDLAPLRAAHRGQVILYLTESAERIVLAESFADWIESIVNHMEQGVYRFDANRGTFVAGVVPAAKDGAAAASASSSSSSSASSARPALPTAASSVIGVEAFMYSALESRDFFILNKTEELVFLAENDFSLLAVTDDMKATRNGDDNAPTYG